MSFRIALAVCVFSCGAFAVLAAEPQTSEPFRRLDRNQDGKLTKDELQGPLFDRIDADKDGVITAEEDRKFVQQRNAAGAPAAQPGGRQPGGLRPAGGAMRVADTVRAELDVPYADTENPRQRLDLYLPKMPKSDKPLPLVVFIHGGGWQNGDRRGGYATVGPLVESGEYVGASIGYRLSGEAIWPAQIHDCKAAIRWLKANAAKYGIDPQRIGVTGNSAGGHLVAMLGTAGDVTALEGSLGQHTNVDSRVACVVDQYGPTELLKMGGRHDDAGSPESKLVGGPIQENQEKTRAASPTSYVTKDDSPTLFIHGTKDPAVPFNQSELLAAALKKVGVEAVLVAVTDGGHGGFNTPLVAERMKQFFDKHLRGQATEISSEPIPVGAARRFGG